MRITHAQDKVKEILGDDNSEEFRRKSSKYAEVKQWIDELGEMKIDTRELAKPPVTKLVLQQGLKQ